MVSGSLPKKISVRQKFDKWNSYETIIHLYEYAVTCYQKENVKFHIAKEEALKLIMSQTMIFLGKQTVVKWIQKGGDEGKAQDAIKDWIMEAKKINLKEIESNFLENAIRKR